MNSSPPTRPHRSPGRRSLDRPWATAVDVDRHDRDGPVLAASPAKLDLELVLEGAVVEDAGERVAQGERLELAPGLVELVGELLGVAPARVAAEHQPERERRGDGGRDRPAAERDDRAGGPHGQQGSRAPEDPRHEELARAPGYRLSTRH
jgi:hypothetical protein